MSGLFSRPDTPKVRTPPPLPPAPERTTEEVDALAEAQRMEFQKRKGRASTWLTGGSGATTPSTSAVRFLGGAAKT